MASPGLRFRRSEVRSPTASSRTCLHQGWSDFHPQVRAAVFSGCPGFALAAAVVAGRPGFALAAAAVVAGRPGFALAAVDAGPSEVAPVGLPPSSAFAGLSAGLAGFSLSPRSSYDPVSVPETYCHPHHELRQACYPYQ